MEYWQKSYIESELDKLLELTSCNVMLLVKLKAAKLLSSFDVEAVKAEKTEQEKVYKLYDVIQAKVQGYEVLTKALYQCNQTGAFKVLLDGFVLQDIKNPLTNCGIEIDRDKLLECKTEFQGQVLDLKDFLESYLESAQLKAFLDSVDEADYVDKVLCGDNRFVLTQNIIPPEPVLYVPRFISNRLKVDQALFKEQCKDIFVFKCIQRYELSNIAEPNSTSISSKQTENISSRFILWECDEDVREICALAKKSGTPVHVIRVENELITDKHSKDNESDFSGRDQKHKTVYILEESNGHSDYLWRFVCGKQQCYMSEEEFLDQIEDENLSSSKGYCICDTPGMGKTLLLQSIARNLFEKSPDRLVVFISFSNLKFTPNSKPLQTVLSQICKTNFSCITLEFAITKGNLKMDLFLDGFDEISGDMIGTAKEFLETVSQNYSNIRLFVTSRPHMRRELEMSLGVIAYDMFPFTEDTQLKYLTNTWKLKLPKSGIFLLEKFAGKLLKHVRSKISPQEKDVLGIPLQCYLLAEVNVKQAQKFAERNHSIEDLLSTPASIFQMYHEFMNQKFEKIEEPEMRQTMWKTHVCAALDIFMPEAAQQLACAIHINHKELSDSVLKLGIMETRHEEYDTKTTQFVHRTFAEFLVTDFFVKLFTKDNLPQGLKLNIACALLQYFFQMEFMQKLNAMKWGLNFFSHKEEIGNAIMKKDFPDFKFPIILYFLNGQLQKSDIQIENIPGFNLYDICKPSKLLDLFVACTCANYLHVIKLLIACIHGIKPERTQKEHHHILLGNDWDVYIDGLRENRKPLPVPLLLLNLAATFSEVETLEALIQFYEKDCGLQIRDIYTKMPPWIKTPQECALERGNYTLVEFFINKMAFENRLSLYHCIHDSYYQTVEIVKQKISICDLLLKKFPHLLTEGCYNNGNCYISGPLACLCLHLDIIKYLIDKGANIFTQTFRRTEGTDLNPVQLAANHFSVSDFHSLCEFLIYEKCKKEYFQPSTDKRSPLPTLFANANDFSEDTRKLILSVNEGNHLTEIGGLLLFAAVTRNKNLDTVKYLIKSGADFNIKKDGRTMLHLAAEHGNSETADFLVKLGLSVNETDESGQTPLMTAFEHKNMIEYLILQGADIKAKDKKGETLFHRYLSARYISEETLHGIFEFFLNSTHEDVASNAIYILRSSTSNNQTPLVLQIIHRVHNPLKKTIDLLCNKCGVKYQISLLHAIDSYDVGYLKNLIESGADINCKNYKNEGVLYLAVLYNKTDLVEYLTNLGVSVNDQSDLGLRPLHMAKSVRLAKHLISCGADIHARNHIGDTFAHIAATWASEEEFAEIIAIYQKTSVGNTIFQIQNSYGETLLHLRLGVCKFDTFTLSLLQNDDVDVNLKCEFGDTLLFLLASTNNHWDLVKTLIQTKSNINARGKNNRSLLHVAASQGNIEMINYFISQGLSIHECDNNGNTPMHLAYHDLETWKHLRNMEADVEAQTQADETVLL